MPDTSEIKTNKSRIVTNIPLSQKNKQKDTYNIPVTKSYRIDNIRNYSGMNTYAVKA